MQSLIKWWNSLKNTLHVSKYLSLQNIFRHIQVGIFGNNDGSRLKLFGGWWRAKRAITGTRILQVRCAKRVERAGAMVRGHSLRIFFQNLLMKMQFYTSFSLFLPKNVIEASICMYSVFFSWKVCFILNLINNEKLSFCWIKLHFCKIHIYIDFKSFRKIHWKLKEK